ncbi:flagellar hook-associated protein FlgL [Thauera aminoaromatica]|uniref:Flagellar hook-associated protein 3 n=1 Tax=Thauera aminoaromatica TaxID=164330 RepID=A0A5C7SPB0_THASP|nr:flagellar hook-associated protein FlgL [Thauera aminoaromatica]TXH85634.1 MAG: flagellar hook-associated protein 3 [Thauera aminoaromatica]
MRVTTGMIYDTGLSSIQKQNSRLLDTMEQVATGRRILRPSDDPVASARALEVSQSKSVNSLYAANQGYANDALKLVDSKLDAATDIVTYVRTRAVESGNGTYSSREQAAIGADITQQFDALLGIANSQDASGDYVFGGYRSNTVPFSGSLAAGVQYQGDQGVRTLQISASRNLPITSSGEDIFNTLRAGSGSAFALSSAGNNGTALVSGLTLSGYDDHNYVVEVAAGPSYQVFDITTDPGRASPIVPTVTLSGGDNVLSFGGTPLAPMVSLSLNGIPSVGDEFSVSQVAATFDVMGNFVNALNSGNKAAARFGSNQAIAGMDAAQESISRVRSGVGSRMVEVETQQNINSSMDLQYEETLSRLQDVDYAEAVSNLTEQKLYLEAAQQSFLKVSNLSLFNYL